MKQVEKVRKRKAHFKSRMPKDPQVRRFRDWLDENKGFYASFRQWLSDTGYSQVSVVLYAVAARLAIGYLDKPYWVIDPEVDVERAWQHILEGPLSLNTKSDYHKGLLKLADYLRLRQDKPPKEKLIRYEFHLATLPEWLKCEIQDFLQHCKRSWQVNRQYEKTISTLSVLSRPLRWMQAHQMLDHPARITPERWFEYLDSRLAEGISPRSMNGELSYLQRLLHFIEERGKGVCQRTFLIDKLEESKRIPRDVPPEQLIIIQKAIQAQAAVEHRGQARIGKMDLSWFLLMLHSGLRTCEVRSLRLEDVDWERQRVRIEQSKGLKDRIVFLSQPTMEALKAYLEVRGRADTLPDTVFVYRHQPLGRFYCGHRLHTYGKHCKVQITPHQLRHSCATLLLNCGAPVLSVQTLLGHKWIDTTLKYARLYDGTVAADYYQAMKLVEKRLSLPEDRLAEPTRVGHLLAMLDALHKGTLNPEQAEIVRQLRAEILAIRISTNTIQDVKVQSQAP